MSKSQNILFFIFFYFIHIKKSIQAGITNDQNCPGNQKYSSLYMQCIEKIIPQNNTNCINGNISREDNRDCITNTACNSNQKPFQRNNFGIFLDKIECSDNRDINPFKLNYSDSVANNCTNEDLIGCQVLINLCTFRFRSNNDKHLCDNLGTIKNKFFYENDNYNFLIIIIFFMRIMTF